MSQYINLYNPALQKRQDAFSARVVFSTALAAALIVSLASIWMKYKVDDLEKQVSQGEALLKSEQDQLIALAKESAERKPDPTLANELIRVEALLKTRSDLVRLFESGGLGKTDGFSELLRAFARQSMNGLWLTKFSISGSDLEIDGKAINADLLPAYIRRLNKEQAFQGRSFAMLKVNRVEEQSQQKAPAPLATTAPQLPPHVTFSLSGLGRASDSGGRQ